LKTKFLATFDVPPNLKYHSFNLSISSLADHNGDISDAIDFILSMPCEKTTNINKALLDGLKVAGKMKSNNKIPFNMDQVVIFLTDGEATDGETDSKMISRNINDEQLWNLECQKIEVIMKNDAHESGIYEKHQYINGKTSWISKTNAIWYVPNYNSWAIGNLKDIGSTTREIASRSNTANQKSPYDVSNDDWFYVANGLYEAKKNQEWANRDLLAGNGVGAVFAAIFSFGITEMVHASTKEQIRKQANARLNRIRRGPVKNMSIRCVTDNEVNKVQIHGMAFGEDADWNLVQTIAEANQGYAKNISDFGRSYLQIEDFISRILAENIDKLDFKYKINGKQMEKNQLIRKGHDQSEYVVLGKLENGNEIQTVEIFVKDENDWIMKKIEVQSCLNTINERCIPKKNFHKSERNHE